MKSNSDATSKYEVKIEPRVQEGSSSTDSIDNIVTQKDISSTTETNPIPTVSASKTFSTFTGDGNQSVQPLPTSSSAGKLPLEKVETRVVLESKNPSIQRPPSQILVDFKSNPKLAFPHSSSFSAFNKNNNKNEAPIHGSQSSGSLTASQARKSHTLPTLTEYQTKKPPNPEYIKI